MSIMFADGAEAPSTNIMDMVSPYAPGFALYSLPLLVTLADTKVTLAMGDARVAGNSKYARDLLGNVEGKCIYWSRRKGEARVDVSAKSLKY